MLCQGYNTRQAGVVGQFELWRRELIAMIEEWERPIGSVLGLRR
jgi:hypothetical protein